MDLNLPLYSASLGAFLIALQTILAAMVGGYRGRNRKAFGYDNDVVLERSVRRHANMAEYAPIFLIVLTLYELLAGQTASVFWLGTLFAVGRVFHVIGFSSAAGSHLVEAKGARLLFVFSRMLGAGLTLVLSLALAVFLAWQVSTLS
ncbi:MAG: MAPEG family protein [Alphaproteobacteria bacterium]